MLEVFFFLSHPVSYWRSRNNPSVLIELVDQVLYLTRRPAPPREELDAIPVSRLTGLGGRAISFNQAPL